MKGKIIMIKTKKDPEIFYYFNAKNQKMFAYRHRYYDSMGKRKEKSKQGFTNEKEAYRELIEVKSQILNGNTKHVENSNLTISEWLDIWYETHKNDWKITSRMQRENAINYQMKPLLGKYKLGELDKTTYKRIYINKLLERYKPSTVRLFHRLFKIAINSAVDTEIIPRNRFNKIVIKDNESENDNNENFLTTQELNIFLRDAKNLESITNYSIILLLAYTGLRRGEALGITWEDIDFEKQTLSVKRTRDNKSVRTPKTKNSYRTILIDKILINQLQEYKKWCKTTKLSFGMRFKENDFIFISYQTGTPVSDNVILYSFTRIQKKTGMKRITPHGLRHTHATILIQERTPLKTIADRLGNTPEMIMSIYGHSFEQLEKESVHAFGNALRLNGTGGTFGGGF